MKPLQQVCCLLSLVVSTEAQEVPVLLQFTEGKLESLGSLRSWGIQKEEEALEEARDSIDRNAPAVPVADAAEVMASVCLETVRLAEEGVKNEQDAMKLGNTVAPVCEERVQERLGEVVSSGPVVQALQDWCSNLDGRLALALETGFLFAREPEEASQEAGGPNPYGHASRRQFCDRFAMSATKAAATLEAQLDKSAGIAHGSVDTSEERAKDLESNVAEQRQQKQQQQQQQQQQQPKPALAHAAIAAATPSAASHIGVAPAKTVVAVAPPSTTAAPAKVAMPVVSSSSQKVNGNPPVHSQKENFDAATDKAQRAEHQQGIDMLHLMQTITGLSGAWGSVCRDFLSGLASEEGSVTDRDVLLKEPERQSVVVLTFNAADQAGIRRCSAQLKVLGIEAGLLHPAMGGSSGEEGMSLISLSSSDDAAMGAALSSADDGALEALVEHPWARDACGDLAHGYLTAKIREPSTTPAEYCPRYSRDLRAIRSADPADEMRQKKEQDQNDLGRLRQRATEHAFERHQTAVAAKAAAKKVKVSVAKAKAEPPASKKSPLLATKVTTAAPVANVTIAAPALKVTPAAVVAKVTIAAPALKVTTPAPAVKSTAAAAAAAPALKETAAAPALKATTAAPALRAVAAAPAVKAVTTPAPAALKVATSQVTIAPHATPSASAASAGENAPKSHLRQVALAAKDVTVVGAAAAATPKVTKAVTAKPAPKAAAAAPAAAVPEPAAAAPAAGAEAVGDAPAQEDSSLAGDEEGAAFWQMDS
jgi:hypothetical protein